MEMTVYAQTGDEVVLVASIVGSDTEACEDAAEALYPDAGYIWTYNIHSPAPAKGQR